MDRNDRNVDKELKASLWNQDDFEIFDSYGKGNTNSKKDTETCLQEYSPRFQWSNNSRVLDFGSGDGSVTSIMAKYIPSGVELIGSDVNDNIIKYANHKYGNGRIKFIRFDVLDQVPEDMKGKFDHIFSMYVLNWIRDHETAFANIYNILPKNGEFFSIFSGYNDLYSIFQILAKRDKWSQWMKNIEQFLSLYHEYEDPDSAVAEMLKKAGFETVNVTCKQRFCIHENIDAFKALITGVNVFDVPKHMWSDFLDDYVEVKRYMNLIDEKKGTVRTNYNLIVIHCIK